MKRLQFFLLIATYLGSATFSLATEEAMFSKRLSIFLSHSHEKGHLHGHWQLADFLHHDKGADRASEKHGSQEHSHELLVCAALSIDFRPEAAAVFIPDVTRARLFIAGESPVFDPYRLSIFRPPISG